jgi:hypothetical protein
MLSEPIFCNDDTPMHRAICDQIKANKIGEGHIFNDGMTLFELFYKYSALKEYCMHSDWLLGFVLEHYLPRSNDDHALAGMERYPHCGNVTVTGEVRQCTQFFDTCHNQEPSDMENFALSSFAKSPDSFRVLPKMETTEIDVASGIVNESRSKNADSLLLPNAFVLGVSEAGSDEVSCH